MITLTVFKFHSPGGAQQLLNRVYALQNQELITIVDAATVSWIEGAKNPRTKQAVNLTGQGTLDGAFWGMLFGLLFFIPILGLAVGAGLGALSGYFDDYGIDDDFIKEVRKQVTPGTSALFLMTSNAVVDRIVDEITGMDFELIVSNLSPEQEERLRTEFVV